MLISVVIPALNESVCLPGLLARLFGIPNLELIVADGGSADGTAEAVERMAGVCLVRCAPGRGTQLNAGAAAASGEILFFLHADVFPPVGFEKIIPEFLSKGDVTAGSFRLSIAARGPAFRLIEYVANLRSRLFDLPYGDQGFFLKRETFDRVGGFADIPLMEDVDLVRRCRPFGSVVTAPHACVVSARRWQKEGWIKTSLRNVVLCSLFLAGVSARRLAAFYPPHHHD